MLLGRAKNDATAFRFDTAFPALGQRHRGLHSARNCVPFASRNSQACYWPTSREGKPGIPVSLFPDLLLNRAEVLLNRPAVERM